jgi:hypothetical protein
MKDERAYAAGLSFFSIKPLNMIKMQKFLITLARNLLLIYLGEMINLNSSKILVTLNCCLLKILCS